MRLALLVVILVLELVMVREFELFSEHYTFLDNKLDAIDRTCHLFQH